MYFLVLDIETQTPFFGRQNMDKLRISVVGVYDSEKDSYDTYFEDDLPRLEERIRNAGLVVGYNTLGFDYIVMQSYFHHIDLAHIPSLDLMKEIQDVIGRRIKLDHVATATLGGEGKSGTGLNAVTLWNEGKLDELAAYCLQDVKITKEIYEYGKKHKEVFFEGWQRKYSVPVAWK